MICCNYSMVSVVIAQMIRIYFPHPGNQVPREGYPIELFKKLESNKMKKTLVFLLLLVTACHQPEHKHKPTMAMPVKTDSSKAELKKLTFDSKTDLVCGMPVRAGVEDTFHYRGKLYGFCAKECKEEFLKDPQQYVTSK